MKPNRLFLVIALIAALIVPAASSVRAQDTWMGKTAAELFPGAANDQERDLAFQALLAANLPDATSRFAGQTLTVSVQQAGARGGISGPYFFWRECLRQLPAPRSILSKFRRPSTLPPPRLTSSRAKIATM